MKVYRRHLDEVVRENDVVVELGAHVGKSSSVILDRLSNESPYKNPIKPLDDSLDLSNGYLISLDNSPEANEPMEKIAENYENFTFINDDVRLHDCLEKVARMIDKCDVLSIDLGGGYHPDTAFKVYYIWASTLKPRDTLIRNRGLVDFVNSSKTDEDISSDEGWLESCHSQGMPPQIKEFKLWTDKLDKK